jgi:very-short-patch-repair endonuclease
MSGSEVAKSLRRRGGHAEDCVWQIVRAGLLDGWKFRRQHPIGRYVVDFAYPELRLVIEVDGDVHALPDVAARDEERTVELSALGWTVLRFPNDVAHCAAVRDCGGGSTACSRTEAGRSGR